MRVTSAVALLACSLLLGTALSEDLAPNCGTGCVDDQIIGAIDRIDREESLPLIGGLELVKTSDEAESARDVSKGVLERIRRYFVNHELVYRADDGETRSEDEEARTSKLKKLMIPLLIALKLKTIVLLPLIVSKLALISIKGIFAGLFALFLSGLTAIKSLMDSKNEPLQAILATPVHSHPHHHHHHDLRWGRHDVQEVPTQLPMEAYNLPYAGYQNLPQAIPIN